MVVLILGSGGREHALAWKISQSDKLTKLFVGPGNAGTSQVAENVALDAGNFEAVASFCIDNEVDVLIPGSEAPLVDGIVDYFEGHSELNHIYVFGPNQACAELEGSKEFAKVFMQDANIPTAAYRSFGRDTIEEAYDFLTKLNPPYVLKADGLAAGKGVVILDEIEEAKATLRDMLLDEKFGDAGARVVIEEFLDGIEFSVFAITDGENYALLPVAKDYKRIGEGDTGLNTGGMGAVSPVPFVDSTLMDKVKSRIVQPTFDQLRTRDLKYVGFVFFGLISVNGDPYVIEYNCRMGDPETEVVIPRLKSDLLELVALSRNNRLSEANISFDQRSCTTVFAVSGGYPGSYPKGKSMNIPQRDDVMYFHAGTKSDGNDVVTSGGRVIAASAYGDTMADALRSSYSGVEAVQFEGKYFRRDIGQDLMANNGNS